VVRAVLSGAVPLDPIEEMPDALPRLLERTTPADVDAAVERAGADLRDPRVNAAFVVAPGGTALLRQESLAAIGVPVGLRWGGADTVNPVEQDVRPLLDAVPGATGAEIGPDVTHHDLIAPLTPGSAGERARVGADAVAFFDTHLRGAAAPAGPLL
jgi:predicted dienelactone hydrolase